MGELYEFASGTTAENPHAIPDFFVTFERSSEMLLDLAVATFNAGPRTPVLVSTGTPGPYNLIWNARRIPLFDAVFRDYGRRGNQSISAEEVRRVFEPSGEDGHLQYQYVRAQVMVGFGQAWGLIVVPEADSAVDQVTEAVMPPAWWEAQVFTRALADVLYAGKDFSVYGRFLRPPQVVSPALETLTVCQVYPRCAAGEFRTHDFPPVLGGAFQAPDGRIGVFLANWTDGERAADVTIDPAWSLADGGAVCRQVFGGPDEAIGTIAGGTAVVSGTLAARTAELLYVVPAPGACGDL
jgi:hypothetical protein